jgi:hypothetical protein
MNTLTAASLLLCGCAVMPKAAAQGADRDLLQAVVGVKAAIAHDQSVLSKYTWTEHTEVLIKGDVKSSTDAICSYDGQGQLQRRPIGAVKAAETPQVTSKRPLNRMKADTADYVERALSLVHTYLPLKPEILQTLMQNGNASLGQAGQGKAEIQFKNYWRDGDLLTFTFDPQSKALLKASIKSYLGTDKDPVTLDALFETLPDGTNHLASTVLNGTAKKIQVKTQNSAYQKAPAQ